VVLVLIDTLRADHLEAYGYEHASAPFLSSVAARAVLFRNAFSTSSWTAPATASVFTGLYPTRHTVTKGIKADDDTRRELETEGAARVVATAIPAAIRTLPQFLQDAGYRTVGVAANINIGSALGFDRGFDSFEHLHRSSAEELSASIRAMHREAGSDRPGFTYIHFNDVHGPYTERAPWYRAQSDPFRARIERYDSEISYVDDVLGRLYRDLAWDRDTIFCVVTDHGEEFKDHGNTGHGFSLFGEVQRVVMILAAPSLDVGPAVVDANVSLVDVLPTILELAGLETPEDADGRSLLLLLFPMRGSRPVPGDGSF